MKKLQRISTSEARVILVYKPTITENTGDALVTINMSNPKSDYTREKFEEALRKSSTPQKNKVTIKR